MFADFFSDFFVPLIAFAIVLFLAYYSTKFVGTKFAGSKKNKTMKIVETLSLGLDRCLYLISVGKKQYLFYSGKKGIELISEIEPEERAEGDSEETTDSATVFDFKKIFETYSGLSQKKTASHGTDQSGEDVEPETTGILGSIKRLQRINQKKQ